MLGNPPWERIKLQEKEWFAERRPAIANAPNAAARRKLIEALREDDPALYAAFQEDRRAAEGESHLVRAGGRYPLCGRGRINTYAIFAETNRMLVGPRGRAGFIVPSGIATDDTTKFFFGDLMRSESLVSLYDFENRSGLFPAVDSRMKFCLLTLAGRDRPAGRGADFAFFLLGTEGLADPERRFTLSAADLALLNPNTRTAPVFRSRRDADLTRAIYQRVPVLIKEGDPEENPWGISFLRMLDMSNDSHLFRTREQLLAEGWRLAGNTFTRAAGQPVLPAEELPRLPTPDSLLPLYEAKLLHHFDHRWATYDAAPARKRPARAAADEDSDDVETRDLTPAEKDDPTRVAQLRYWVPAAEVAAKLAGRWERGWLLGWRDICRSTDERTVIAGVLPRYGTGDTLLLMLPEKDDATLLGAMAADLDSFVLDYAARQKIGGTHMKYHVFKQLPVLSPTKYIVGCPWAARGQVRDWLAPRVLELTYTAWDLEPFAKDLGYHGPPFRWDEDRRFLLRCELDAAFFHLYGIAQDDVDYIMDTFPIVRRKDEARFPIQGSPLAALGPLGGDYRTKRVILEMYDEMARARAGGPPYQTRLDPPPADARAAHGEARL